MWTSYGQLIRKRSCSLKYQCCLASIFDVDQFLRFYICMSQTFRTWAAADTSGTWNFRKCFAKCIVYTHAQFFKLCFFFFLFRRLSSLWHDVWSLLISIFCLVFLQLLWKVCMRKVNLVLSVFIFIRAYCHQCTEAKYKEMCGIVSHYKFMNTGTLLINGIMCLI